MLLATLCPDLRTIIIQLGKTVAPVDHPLRQPLSVETAAYYATLPGSPSPDLGPEELDGPYLRSLLLEYFGDSPPNIHLVSPDFTNR